MCEKYRTLSPGFVEREDYEYEHCGMCNIFMAVEPLSGRRCVSITERRTKQDWSICLEEISTRYSYAEKITLVMDNLNIHTAGSLYETFMPAKTKELWDRFEFIYTPKHGVGSIWRKWNLMFLSGNAFHGVLKVLSK